MVGRVLRNLGPLTLSGIPSLVVMVFGGRRILGFRDTPLCAGQLVAHDICIVASAVKMAFLNLVCLEAAILQGRKFFQMATHSHRI